MTKNELSPYERGFLEGLIDADGSIIVSIDKPHTEVRLIISNNSLELLQKVKGILNRGFIINKKGENFEFRLSSNGLRWLLPQIKLIVKEGRRINALKVLGLRKLGINQHSEVVKNWYEVCKIYDIKTVKD